MIRRAIGMASIALLGLSATACSEDRETTKGDPDIRPRCSLTELIACSEGTSIAPYIPDVKTKATGEPLTIGMINQENTPAGSFPELSQSANAFVEWINTELDGVHGRPLKIDVCNTGFSAEGSTACGERFALAKVPVVLGGIDIFGTGIDTLGNSGIPFVGGIPVSDQSMKSANSFQWSGGSWGAAAGFSIYAADTLNVDHVAIVYADFGSIAESATTAETLLKNSGVETVEMIPFPVIATDLASPLQAAWTSKPDAIFVLAADTGCKAAFDASKVLEITAAMFYTGACAAPTITEAAGNDATQDAYFSVEGEVNRENPDADSKLYSSVMAAYAPDLNPIGVPTVSARAMMNLYAILQQAPADSIDAATITALLREQRDAPSFMGHPYTCDGKQFPELQATCSPQQIILQMRYGILYQVGDWIDVGKPRE